MRIKRIMGEKGQVVIPRDLREMIGIKGGEKIVFEVVNNKITLEKEEDSKEFLKKFFSVSRTKEKDLTLEDMRRIEEESYDDIL